MNPTCDPSELAAARIRREQSDRNAAWLQAHASEIFPVHRGKCICVSGEQLFVADTASEAVAMAAAVHPHDEGRFVHYIPKEKVSRIYAS
ncbi:MAG: hypothetical protein R3C19_03865 [Planctomycetaceae bacterium]